MAATAVALRPRRPALRRPGFGADDERLVTRVRDGDDTAFEAIYDRYAAGLLAFCRHMLSSRDDAEDAVQHSLGAAYRMLRANDREIELRPWLYTIARNRCLSVLRARRKDVSLDAAPEHGGIGDELIDQVQRRSDLRDLVQDLRLLPDAQRAALVLFELGGLPHDEIATVLEIRREKVKALIFQAREGLMRARLARDTPCTDMRRQLATLRGSVPKRGMLRRHVDRCPSCALFEAEVARQRAGLALIFPALPPAALKAIVLGSTVGGGAAAAGAGAGGGAAVLGAGGAGGAACAGAGGAAAGVAGAGAAGGASILAGAAGGGMTGAVATATGAGTIAAALGAHSATAVVAKLLTVATLVGGGSAATGDLARYAPGAGGAPAVYQAAPAVPPPDVLELLAPAAPVPTVAPPVLTPGAAVPTAAGGAPLPATASDLPFRPPAAMSQPAPGPAATTPAAPDGHPPATVGIDPGATPAPSTATSQPQPPATAPVAPGAAGAAPTTTPPPATTPGSTATSGTTTTSGTTPSGATTTSGAGVNHHPATGDGTPAADHTDPTAGAKTPTTAAPAAPPASAGAGAKTPTTAAPAAPPASAGAGAKTPTTAGPAAPPAAAGTPTTATPAATGPSRAGQPTSGTTPPPPTATTGPSAPVPGADTPGAAS